MESNAHAQAIDLRGLRKHFGPQTVLDDVSLSVAPGETLAVLGRSGVGKSVLLKLIIGLQQPDAGEIAIHGQNIVGLPVAGLNEIRTRIGFLFQDAALYDAMTVEDNVAFPLRRHQRSSPAEQRDKARSLLADMNMSEARTKMPSEISGGMKKRVGLARALALDPDILLFDEPTAGLDPITAGEIDDMIVHLKSQRRLAAIVVTHDLRTARAVADRVAFLDKGRVVLDGRFEDLERAGHDMVARFVSQAA